MYGSDDYDSSDEEANESDDLLTRKPRSAVSQNEEKKRTLKTKATKGQKYIDASTKLTLGNTNRICGPKSLPMAIEPAQLHFESVQPGILYVMTMSIRNISQIAQRIRIKAPKSGFFALNYIPSGVVSPGLDIRAQIECQLPEGSTDLEYLDTITVVMGESILEVPIVATKKVAELRFDSLLNFGFVAKGNTISREVSFENRGEIPCSVKLVSSRFLAIQPSKFSIAPNERQSISVTLEGIEVGVFRDPVEVQIEGALNNMVLDVSAHCVPQVLSLLKANGGGIIEDLEFGPLYYGESKRIKAYVVNSGPEQLSFTVVCTDEDEKLSRGKTPAAEEDLSNAPEKSSVLFSPSEGVIKPFSQLPVTICFSPEMPVPDTGFQIEYLTSMKETTIVSKKAILESIETGQKLSVNITGSVSLADININPSVLKFGSCAVNDRRDILVEISNNSVSAVPFAFTKNAQFKISPSEGVLEAHQSRSVIATFHPGQLGNFKTALQMSVSNGLQTLELHLSGEANDTGGRKTLVGGLNKTAQDFNEKFNFVNPSTVEAEIKAKQETILKKKLEKTRLLTKGEDKGKEREVFSISTGSLTREAIYGQIDDVSKSGAPGENHPLTLKQQNDAVYNTYLQAQHFQRTEAKKLATQKLLTMKGGINRSDPFGVDMGMERALDEPKLAIPKADTELWLASKAPRGSDGKGRLPFDENRLIQRKYSDTPSTQAELRDCTAELTAEEIKLVHTAQKVLNFGKVNIGSVVTKNFAIINDMSHSVCATIEDLELELKQSKPEKQIIPAGAMAGFDIYFASRTLGEYKKAFTWTLNGIHNFKVLIKAEVIPIELILSKTNLILEFGPTSLESSLSAEVTMTNPGNAPAEYLWGSAGAFTCKPEQGTIFPGKSAVVTITWTPMPGKRNEEELGLHINSGVDQVLKVRGLIKESKMYFEDKILNFGTISTGLDQELTTYIKNAGTSSSVFCFDPIDEKYGISISPKRGIIEPGESTPVTVCIHPLEAMRYDRVRISASIRGSKGISFRLDGESIIPQLSILEEAFLFGAVAIGSEWRLPLTIFNASNIPGSLVLNLDSHQEFRPGFSSNSTSTDDSNGSGQDDEFGNQIILIPQDATSSKHKNVNAWKLTVAPGGSLAAVLIFAPTVAKSHDFKLPIQRQGMKKGSDFDRTVTAEATPSRLAVSSRLVDFGDRVVDRDPIARASYYLEITFTNPDMTQGISYEIRERDLEPVVTTPAPVAMVKGKTISAPVPTPSISPSFFISPLKGSLGAGSWCPIRVTFQPQDSITYSKIVDIYIDGQVTGRPYMSIVCKGTGAYPRLSFDRPIVQLPTVPLGVTSRASFTIFNHGYGTLELRYRLSPTIPLPVDVVFPDGAEVGISVMKVQVIVSAKSDTPTSWSGKIEFYDNDGERFYLYLCGCSDNSLLTNYSFVRAFSGNYSFVGLDEHPVRYLPKDLVEKLREKENIRKENLRKQRMLERQQQEKPSEDKASEKDKALSTKQLRRISLSELNGDYREGVEIGSEASSTLSTFQYSPLECAFLLKWLNAFVCKRQFEVARFPDCVIESGGELVIECIELLSGARIPGVRSAASESIDPKRVIAAGDSSAPPTAQPGSRATPAQQQKQIVSRLGLALKTMEKYKALIAFVIRSGGLLNHLDPSVMLSLDDFYLVQEHELKEREGARFTNSILKENSTTWEARWQQEGKYCWFELLLQAIKVFSISRVTYKELQKVPGLTIKRDDPLPQPPAVGKGPPNPEKSGQGESGKKAIAKKEKLPLDLVSSNVYSTPELILLFWASHHLQRSVNLRDEGVPESSAPPLVGLKHRILDVESEFADLYGFCQILHSHLPELTKTGSTLCGYSHQHSQVSSNSPKREEYFFRLRDTLKEIHLYLDASREELSASGRVQILLLLQMFFALPGLMSKSTIEFTGLVGLPIVKTIELRNPSKKPVRYEISLKGSQFYSVEGEEVVIPAETMVDVPVTLLSRFLAPATAQITFWGVREAGVAGSTMVFQLASNLTGRSPVESISKSLNLFEWDTYHIPIRNPYPNAGVFPLVLRAFHTPITTEDVIKTLTGKPIKSKGKDISMVEVTPASDRKDDDVEFESLFSMPFWCDDSQLQLGPCGSQGITLHACPFLLGKYTCQLIFADPNVGEFSYDIVLDVTLNKSSEKLEFNATQTKKGQVRKAMRIASRNVAFERAVSMLTDHRLSNPNKKLRAKSILQGCIASLQQNEDIGEVLFNVEFLNPFFNSSKQINFISEYLIGPETREKQVSAGLPKTAQSNRFPKIVKSLVEDLAPADSERTPNTAIISFTPDKVGSYQGRAIVFSSNNPYDIRVLDLHANVTVPPTKMLIEFHGPAKQTISQDIPIKNDQDRDLNLTVTVAGRGFSAPKTLFIPRGNTVDLKVQFTSPVAGSVEGTLSLRNSENGVVDTFAYALLGVATEPVAEDNLTFLCKSRCRERFSIPIKLKKSTLPPPDKKSKEPEPDTIEQILTASTDIPYLTGPSEVRVINGEGVYEFNVMCPVSGLLSGSISFTDSYDKLALWFTVDIDVTSPKEESTIQVSAVVRTAVSIELSLENPTNSALKFNVILDGEGLIGENTHVVQSSSVAPSTYELIYSPLIIGSSTGKIRFLNPTVGEFWYKLEMNALPAPVTEIELIECMIGCSKSVMIPIENPLSQVVILTANLSDAEHFSLPNDITLQPYAQTSFEVVFRPSTLSDIVTCDLLLSHSAFGVVSFALSGKGLMPGIMPITNIFCPLQEIGSYTVTFRNPFNFPLPVDFVLLDEDVLAPQPKAIGNMKPQQFKEKEKEPFAFGLLLRKATDIVIQPKASFPIGVSFVPQRLGQYCCNIQARTALSGLPLLWIFPIVGMAESAAVKRLPRISSACKTSFLKDIHIPLEGLNRQDLRPGEYLQQSDFNVDIIVEPKYQNLVNRAFRAQILQIIDGSVVEVPHDLAGEVKRTDFYAKYRLLFEPLRTFTSSLELIISCKARGRWKLLIELESTDPEPDDVIQLVAPVGGSDKISFRLSNRFLGLSNFEAYFTAKSSPHFAVSPATGVLAQYGTEGTPFIVTFAPLEYGVIEVGNLVISTEDAQWNYKIVGHYPSAAIKQSAIKSKVDTGLSKHASATL